jgi:hypothetical protein
METDISHLGDASRFEPAPLDDYQEFQAPPQYHQQPQYEYVRTPSVVADISSNKKSDFFADIDKKAWIFIIVALIIGFFMGKTMQPIILRTG